MIELSKIRIDGGTQSRVKIDESIIDEYADAIKSGEQFPAISVMFDGVDYWLVDGFHRYFATKKIGIDSIEATTQNGTRRDAVLASLKANTAHGLRRSNADKRKAVMTMLDDEEWSEESDNSIAKICAVTQPFVSKLRKDVITVITPKKITHEISKEKSDEIANNFDDYEPSQDEILEAQADENERLLKIESLISEDANFESLVIENKNLTEKIAMLESRINGLLAEKNELLKKIKSLSKK